MLSALCLGDLISTVWLLKTQGAAEANPLMNRFLEHGTGAFICAKLGFSLLPLMLLEWARRRSPNFVRHASRVAVAAYLFCYCLGVVRENAVIQIRELPPDPIFRTQHQRNHSQGTPLLAVRRHVADIAENGGERDD